MLLSDNTTIAWNPRNKKRYVDLGYRFTKMGDVFSVSVEDLTRGSSAKVNVRCDYCGCEYEIDWRTYFCRHEKAIVSQDACGSCCERKASDAIKKKYGSHSNMHKQSDEKRRSTNMQKYGTENVFGSEAIKQKIVHTNMEKYGVPYTQQAESVRNKTMETCMERYGVKNYVEVFKGKFIKENSPVWNGGVVVTRQERATHEYIQWRKGVFERDLYTCQCCGSKNGNGRCVEIHAHHILNWLDNTEHRYDIDNGITLCSDCHYKFHSMFGKHNNTHDQLIKFLNSELKSDKKIC